jgi:hypothetical protein
MRIIDGEHVGYSSRMFGEKFYLLKCPQCGQIGMPLHTGIEYDEKGQKIQEINPPPFKCPQCGQLLNLPVELDRLLPPEAATRGMTLIKIL